MARANDLETLRKLSRDELKSKVLELKGQLAEQAKSLKAQELPNPRVISKTRKEIARALTLLNEKVETKVEATEGKEK